MAFGIIDAAQNSYSFKKNTAPAGNTVSAISDLRLNPQTGLPERRDQSDSSHISSEAREKDEPGTFDWINNIADNFVEGAEQQIQDAKDKEARRRLEERALNGKL